MREQLGTSNNVTRCGLFIISVSMRPLVRQCDTRAHASHVYVCVCGEPGLKGNPYARLSKRQSVSVY